MLSSLLCSLEHLFAQIDAGQIYTGVVVLKIPSSPDTSLKHVPSYVLQKLWTPVSILSFPRIIQYVIKQSGDIVFRTKQFILLSSSIRYYFSFHIWTLICYFKRKGRSGK